MTLGTSAKVWLQRGLPAVLLVVGFASGAWLFSGDSGQPAPAQVVADAQVWTCSMHPQIRQPEPGLCPICGMDLIQLTSAAGGHSDRHVTLSERAAALARISTSAVTRLSDQTAEVRLLGRVEPNEASVRAVTAWTGGRIDQLKVNVTGTRVRAGQVIATLYSPEVFTAHQDLITAKKQVDALASGSDVARAAATAALNASRERLRLLGVPDDELARLEGQSSPTRAINIRSPFSGTVMERLVTQGAYVSTGMPLYQIANLGSVWVQLEAYEADLSRIAIDQTVRLKIDAFPDEVIEGKITFIEPTIDPMRRTAKVRVEVSNEAGRLRPGMYAEAVVAATMEGRSPLVVPASAPLFTGRRSVVYVEVPDAAQPSYEPRTVRLGPKVGDFYPVVAGLSEGERVVTKGAFVLDADLQIRGGNSMMSSPDDRHQGAFDEIVSIKPEELESLRSLLLAYLDVQRALAADNHAGAKEAASQIQPAVDAVKFTTQNAQEPWTKISIAWTQNGRRVAQSADIEAARQAFEGLSHAAIEMLKFFGNPISEPVVQAHCPMALGSQGASWIQLGDTIDNSYFGESMRRCGDVTSRVDPGAHLSDAVKK